MADETKTQDMSALEEFAQGAAGMYLKFDDSGEPIEGIYLGFSVEEDPFNPGKQRIAYELEVAQESKFLSSSSRRLAKAMLTAKVKKGDFIRVYRDGEGFDTDYRVESSDIPF